MAIRGPRRERDGSIVYNSHVPLKQPVAQAKRKHRFRFILTEIDKPFFILVMVLLVFGLLMMFSASYAFAETNFRDSLYFARNQMIWILIGFVVLCAATLFVRPFFH